MNRTRSAAPRAAAIRRNVVSGIDEVPGLRADRSAWAASLLLAVLVLALSAAIGASRTPVAAESLLKLSDLEILQQRLSHYSRRAEYGKAMPLARRYVTIAKARYGENAVAYAKAIAWEAFLHAAQARPAEAVPLYERALRIYEQGLPPGDPLISSTLNNLAFQHMTLRRFDQAEPLFQRALEVREKSAKPDPVAIAGSVNNLATLRRAQGRLAEAEPLLKRALQLRREIWPEGHPEIAASLGNLALLYHAQRRFREAEPLLVEALAMRRKLQPAGHPEIAGAMNNLALNYSAQDRIEEAQPLLEQTLELRQRNQPAEHPEVASSINNLAMNYFIQEKYDDAERLFKRALTMQEKAFPADHPQLGATLRNLATLEHERGRPVEALGYVRRASQGLVARGGQDDGHFRRHVTIAWRTVERGAPAAGPLFDETFRHGQRASQTRAAEAVARMAARVAADDPALGKLIRTLEALESERSQADKKLSAALALPTDQRRGADDRARQQLRQIARQIDAIDRRLRAEHPDYFSLVKSTPLAAAAVQAQLRADEALVLFLDTREWYPGPEATFVWVITKTASRWVRSELGTKALGDYVTALRCGLDAAVWNGDADEEKCVGLLKAYPPQVNVEGQVVDVLPFDLDRAHALYAALLAPVEDLIEGRHLLIVPSGSLAVLPFHVLVTEPPALAVVAATTRKVATFDDYRRAAWLGTRQPITVLPSVASLERLRHVAKASRAGKTYLGVGNPLLDGPNEDWRDAAEAARKKRVCPKEPSTQLARAPANRPTANFSRVLRGAQADIEAVRLAAPLPETADELCRVGHRLGISESDVLLGNRATEGVLKILSDQGRLADYAILHFATHGALAGKVQGLAEPGLVLTPPAKGTKDPKALARDDGFLTASEIATLKLDADWVILSACNTASGTGNGAEALSGIARAFFYAGARALLVSHWEVGSDAAVELTTRAFAELKSGKDIGRAEALRRSMRDLIANGSPADAHPMIWAPFVVVGEGAPAR